MHIVGGENPSSRLQDWVDEYNDIKSEKDLRGKNIAKRMDSQQAMTLMIV